MSVGQLILLSDPDEEKAVGDAIRTHFGRRSRVLRRNLHQLMRRGLISLAIGLAFPVTLLLIAQATGLVAAERGFPTAVREGMLIVGWVAMWRPLDIFL